MREEPALDLLRRRCEDSSALTPMPCFFCLRSKPAATSCKVAFFVLALSGRALLSLFADRWLSQRLVVTLEEHCGWPDRRVWRQSKSM